MTAQEIKLVVVDDHPLIGTGIQRLVEGSPIRLVETVTSIDAAVACAEFHPDVILLDLRLGNELTSDAVPRLRAAMPDTHIVIFTAFPEHVAVEAAIAAGASGCLAKDLDANDILAALQAVVRGERLPVLSQEDSGAHLSPQEQKILLRVARGETNAEIARSMHLSSNTVKTYWQSALCKLNARNRAEAIARAHDVGLL